MQLFRFFTLENDDRYKLYHGSTYIRTQRAEIDYMVSFIPG
jgi:hypothetical protein